MLAHAQAILFFLWGLTLAFVGLYDTFTTLSLGDRVSSVLLAVVGVAIISGGVVSWKPLYKRPDLARRHDLVGLATAALSIVAGIVILAAIRSNFDPQPRLVAVEIVVMTITTLSGLAAVPYAIRLWKNAIRLWKNRGKGTPANGGQLSKHPAAVIGAAATILAALIAVPQAWYSSQYLPSTATPALSIKSKLSSPLPHRLGLAATTAQVEIKNTGRAPVTVLTSMYEITGTRIGTAKPVTAYPDPQRVDHATRVEHPTIDNPDPGPSGRYSAFSLYGPAQLVQFGRLVFDQAWLEPGEYTTATVVAYFPEDEFDLLRLTTDIAFIREDRVTVGDPSPVNTEQLSPNSRLVKGCEDGNVYLTLWPVEERTLFRRLTESDREVVVALVAGPTGEPPAATREATDVKSGSDGQWWPDFPGMYASIQHKGRSCGHVINPEPSTKRGLEDRSMFSKAGSVSEVEIRH
ncbi:MAG: hypothetical protein ACM3ML_14840 [Micromonosporaceae bacterium]